MTTNEIDRVDFSNLPVGVRIRGLTIVFFFETFIQKIVVSKRPQKYSTRSHVVQIHVVPNFS